MPPYREIWVNKVAAEEWSNWRAFFPENTRRLPHHLPAVYALYRGRKLVYVGQTINLRARFNCAYRRRPSISFAKARYVHPIDLDRIERRLIRRLKPEENKIFTGRPRIYGLWV